MLIIPSAALALFSAIVALATLSSDAEQLVSANLSCTSDQTQCALGCCPYAHAECCSDGYECCQHGQTCIPYIGICIGLVNEEKKDIALVSTRAIPVKNPKIPCPSSFTTCGPDKCCLFPDATCCSDGEHCCPNGYRCDIPNRRCLKNSDNSYSTLDTSMNFGMKTFGPFQAMRKDPYKTCPGGARQCPIHMSCCLDDNGAWSCCPNPASPQYRKKGSNTCCNTAAGYICCPGPCSYFLGCLGRGYDK